MRFFKTSPSGLYQKVLMRRNDFSVAQMSASPRSKVSVVVDTGQRDFPRNSFSSFPIHHATAGTAGSPEKLAPKLSFDAKLERLRHAVGSEMHNAAASIRRPEASVSFAQYALWALKAGTYSLDAVEIDAKVSKRIGTCRFTNKGHTISSAT
jgi:hypothetical protein